MLNYSAHGLKDDNDPEKYWTKVFSLRNIAGQEMFLNLKFVKIASLLLVHPLSNAPVEIKFCVL